MVDTMDLPLAGYHRCTKMPSNEFCEKQQLNWHIHKTDKEHSEYRKDLIDDICPYCHSRMEDTHDRD